MYIMQEPLYISYATESFYFKNAQYIVRLCVGSFYNTLLNVYLPCKTAYVEIYGRINYHIIDAIHVNNLSEIISYLQSFGIDDIISDISATYVLISLDKY